MKTFKFTSIASIIVSIIALICSGWLEFQIPTYIPSCFKEINNNLIPHRDFFVNLFLGILASGILLLVASIVGYYLEKARFIKELRSKANALRLFIKKLNTSHMDENLTVSITLNKDFIDDLFEILPYSLEIVEFSKQSTNKLKTDEIDIAALRDYCKKINIICEYIMEMSVNKDLTVDFNTIAKELDLKKINAILKIAITKSKKELLNDSFIKELTGT